MSIDDVFDTLPLDKQQQLLVALEASFMQIVFYEENKWIGVNVVGRPKDVESGVWSLGSSNS